MSARLKFVDEPPSNVSPRKPHYLYAEQCRNNPGKWAKVSTHKNLKAAEAMVWQTNNGKRKPYPEGFEAVARTQNGGMAALYVRYVGTATENSAEAEDMNEAQAEG